VRLLAVFCAFVAFLATTTPVFGARIDREVKLADGTDVSVDVYPAEGTNLLLWIYGDNGRPATGEGLSTATAALGLEVWAADFVAANFLPVARSSLEEIPGKQVLGLIGAAYKATGKTIFLYAGGRAAVPALRGALAWQNMPQAERAPLGGVVFMSPNLYVGIPEPGTDAQYLPETTRLSLPVYHIQPQLSPWFWYRDRLKARLEQGGSTVVFKVLPKVRGRFEFRPDAWPVEDATAKEVPVMLRDAVATLSQMTSESK
jgi:hypothetical protein